MVKQLVLRVDTYKHLWKCLLLFGLYKWGDPVFLVYGPCNFQNGSLLTGHGVPQIHHRVVLSHAWRGRIQGKERGLRWLRSSSCAKMTSSLTVLTTQTRHYHWNQWGWRWSPSSHRCIALAGGPQGRAGSECLREFRTTPPRRRSHWAAVVHKKVVKGAINTCSLLSQFDALQSPGSKRSRPRGKRVLIGKQTLKLVIWLSHVTY